MYSAYRLSDIFNPNIHISISMFLGLTEKVPCGSLCIPNCFSRMDVKTNSYYVSEKRNVENHLINTYREILNDNERLVKCESVMKISADRNMYIGEISQIDDLWFPDGAEEINIL